ncbi:MAG TPA: FtsQ-type POTRA domain-containing protein [Pyrinomonadaceae bacterium]
MREQVVTPRASARGAVSDKARSGGITQRPARRERGAAGARSGTLRKVLGLMPLITRITLATLAGVLIFAGYRAAASASFFQARSVDVSGATRASADEIKRVVRRHAAHTGVWRADLAAISRELEGVAWVRSAVVSRVLPDGLRVRVTERVPRAVVRMAAGRLVWVDEDAVSLDAVSPTDQMPAFFIRGWDESGTDAARAENHERMEKYLEMSREWEAAKLVERVSEVNLIDVRDVRAQLAGDDAQIEVRLGSKDFGKRLGNALKVLDEQRGTPRAASITYLDATLERRVIVGFSSGAQASSESEETLDNAEAESARLNVREPESREKRNIKKEARDKPARKESDQKRKKERAKKEAGGDEPKTQTRPRRVG